MNRFRLFCLVCILSLTGGVASLLAQNTPIPNLADQPAPGNTVIDSDELHMDEAKHTSVYTGHVVVTGTNFKMTCQEMTVLFDNENKVATITGTGDVVIIQPGRITHSGEARYFHDEDKIVLTVSPVINNNGNILSASKIIIFRNKQSISTEGPAHTILAPSHGIDSTSAPSNK